MTSRSWVHPFHDHPAPAAEFDRVLLAFGEWLAAEQRRGGYTQEQVVARARPHMSRRGLRLLLKARCDPKLSTLVRLADALDCRVTITLQYRVSPRVPA